MPFRKTNAPTAEQPVRAERFRSALHPRVLGTAGLVSGQNFRALLLERGEAVLRNGEGETPLFAPLAAWMPWPEGTRLQILAGAQGSHILLGQGALERMLQRRSEAAQVRYLAERTAVMTLKDPIRPVLEACFDGILAETVSPGPMAENVVDSFLHILLVQFFRAQSVTPQLRSEVGGSAALAARFITLVEANFRTHWTIERYAKALGVSRDRLTDNCQAVHGKPPGVLIRTRMALEARLMLETSTLTLDRIAGALGFGGAAQFNRFFSAQFGIPPGRYRKSFRDATVAQNTTLSAPYEWP